MIRSRRWFAGGAEGCPIAVEVFQGNAADPATVAAQVTKLGAPAHRHWLGGDAALTSGRTAGLKPARPSDGELLRAPQIAPGREHRAFQRRCSMSVTA
jgi:hypothetical protein